METLVAFLASKGMGVLTGFFGGLVTKWIEYKTYGEKLEYDKEMARIRKEELELEHKHALLIMEKELQNKITEGNIAKDIEEVKGFRDSLTVNQIQYGGWVDQLRGATRPVITFLLLGMFFAFTVWVGILVGGLSKIPEYKLMQIWEYLLESIVFLSVTAVAWWFGSRAAQWKKLNL